MKRNLAWRSSFFPRQGSKTFERVKGFLPPFAVDRMRDFLSGWEYVPEGWARKDSQIAGWDVSSVADAQEKHRPVLASNLEGTGPLGASHFPWVQTREDQSSHNAMMAFGYVLARSARKKDRLSMLDWGGGAGHYYLYSRALLPEVEIEYYCHDLPLLCQLGRKLVPQAKFDEDPAALLNRQYDLVMSSSSLHYFEDWRDVTRKLAATAGEFLYVARLQTVSREPSFVVIQRPYRSGYDAEYLSWFLNRDEFVACVEEAGLGLVREFIYAEEWFVRGAPEKGACRGFLFQRRFAGEKST